MVLLAPMVTALQTLLEVCRADAEPHDIVYNTTNNENIMYAGPTKAITRYCLVVRPSLTQQESGSEIRNLDLKTIFVTWDMS